MNTTHPPAISIILKLSQTISADFAVGCVLDGERAQRTCGPRIFPLFLILVHPFSRDLRQPHIHSPINSAAWRVLDAQRAQRPGGRSAAHIPLRHRPQGHGE